MTAATLIASAFLCLTAPDHDVRLPADRFTLVWTHSIEKIDWEEDYVVVGRWLYLSGARIRGSGAGMEPPDDAQLVDGVFVYRPAQRWFRKLDLARSAFVRDYRVCIAGRCQPMSNWIPVSAGTTRMTSCVNVEDRFAH